MNRICFTMRSITSLRQQLLVPQGTLRSPEKKKADAFASAFLFWRSRRDLNPRYPFGVHTISSRARYDHFDTAPCGCLSDSSHIIAPPAGFVKHYFYKIHTKNRNARYQQNTRRLIDIFANAKSIYRRCLFDISANADSICYKSPLAPQGISSAKHISNAKRLSKIPKGFISSLRPSDGILRRSASAAGPPSGCTSGWRRYRCGP